MVTTGHSKLGFMQIFHQRVTRRESKPHFYRAYVIGGVYVCLKLVYVSKSSERLR
jgi:hypothetical protein